MQERAATYERAQLVANAHVMIRKFIGAPKDDARLLIHTRDHEQDKHKTYKLKQFCMHIHCILYSLSLLAGGSRHFLHAETHRSV